MLCRLSFLFVDAFSYQDRTKNSNQIHYSAEKKTQEPNFPEIHKIIIHEDLIDQQSLQDIQDDFAIDDQDIQEIKFKDLRTKEENSSILEDIYLLEKLYKKAENKEILYALIEKLAQDYQFDKAKYYADELVNSDNEQQIDPHLYLYILFNSSELSIVKEKSIESINLVVEEYRIRGLLSMDDYRYYQGLIKLRYYDYVGADILFKQITSPRYTSFLTQLHSTLSTVSQQKDIPAYYQDALTSLLLLKNWHFSISKKIALDVLNQNDEYVLPYQILAYSHFLTNNRETAIEYFFKLADFDPRNGSLYKFLIGTSYYRMWKNEESVLYLSQVEKTAINQATIDQKKEDFDANIVLWDVYRYMLLNYIQLEDYDRSIRIWNKLLWQQDLNSADYYTHFFQVLYIPFMQGKQYAVYNKNPQLVHDYVEKCYKDLWENEKDVCIYGQAGYQFLQWEKQEAKDKLLYLAKNYQKAYIFHTLWDFYYQEWQFDKAKRNYVKAVSMTEDPSEEVILKRKLVEFVTNF